MSDIRLHSLVKTITSQIEGQVKIVEKQAGKTTHVYITLNKGFKHPDARQFEVSHEFRGELLRCPISSVELREASTPKDIYKLIDEKDLEGIKLLSDRGLNKKPTVNAQKQWGTSMNYAIMFGNQGIISYMLEKGLKPIFNTGGRYHMREMKTPYDMLISSSISDYNELSAIWSMFTKLEFPVNVSEYTMIWGPMGVTPCYGRATPEQAINKTKVLFENYNVSDYNKEKMLQAGMYNGRVEWSKFLISQGVSPKKAFSLITNGASGENYCKEQLKKNGSSLEELYKLYDERNK